MNRRPRWTVAMAMVAVVVIVCAAGAWTMWEKPALPVRLGMVDGRLEIASAISPAFRHGDRLLEINGEGVTTPEHVELVLDNGWLPGTTTILEIERAGIQITVIRVPIVRCYDPFYMVTLVLTAALFIGLAVAVLRARPDDPAARLFGATSVAVAVMITTSWGAHVGPSWLGPALMVVNGFAYTLVPACFVTFTALFPTPRPRVLPWLRPAAFTIALAIATWRALAYLAFLASPQALALAHPDAYRSAELFLAAFDAGRVFMLVGVLAGLLSFIHAGIVTEGAEDRRKLRWVMLGLGIAIPGYVILWQIPTLLGHARLAPEALILLLVAVVPITFAISIAHHRLMDVDLLISRSSAYLVVVTALLALYVGVVAAIAAMAGEPLRRAGTTLSALTAVLVALLFEPARARIQRAIDRVFFRSRYDLRKAQAQIASSLRQAVGPADLASRLIERILSLVPVTGLAVVASPEPGRPITLLAHHGLDGVDAQGPLSLPDETRHALLADPDHVEPGIAIDGTRADRLRDVGAALAVPVIAGGGTPPGLLVIGPRRSRARFTREDIELFAAAAGEAGLALDRLALQQSLLLKDAESRRLAELNRIQTLFVSGVSHDMRTPLASIRMFSELLAQGLEAGEMPANRAREYLEIVEGEASRLARLIENVLEYARIERQARVYSPEHVDLSDAVRQTLRALRYLFRINHVTLRVALHPGPLPVHADPDAIEAALTNLVTNAIKYSPVNKRLTVRTLRDGSRAGFSVADRGIGIAAEDLPHLFEPFFRSADPAVRDVGGAGLGLMLVRHAAEAHGGSVALLSTLGEGSTFTFWLPMEDAP